MKIRILYIFLLLLGTFETAWSQNDFAVRWNVHVTGDTVEEDPFNGGFTITNVGPTTIPANDTLWYGYIVEGSKYDLSFNIGAVSGRVLDEDFAPEEEIAVVNNFYWPILWESGATIEICATVYGVTYESYTGTLFTGDDDISNNMSCIFAVLPEYTVDLKESADNADFEFFYSQGVIHLVNHMDEIAEAVPFHVYNASGQEVLSGTKSIPQGNTAVFVNHLSNGLYFLKLQVNGVDYSLKFLVGS